MSLAQGCTALCPDLGIAQIIGIEKKLTQQHFVALSPILCRQVSRCDNVDMKNAALFVNVQHV